MGNGEWGMGNGERRERGKSVLNFLPSPPTPYSLLPTPYSLLPTPYSPLPTPVRLTLTAEAYSPLPINYE